MESPARPFSSSPAKQPGLASWLVGWVPLWLAVLGGCGGSEPRVVTSTERTSALVSTTETPTSLDDATAIRRLVLESQTAGWVTLDAQASLRAWTEDATLTLARSAGPGPHDVTLDAAHRAASLRMVPSEPQRSLAQDEVEVEVDGDAAVLRALTRRTSGWSTTRVRERYELRRTPSGWRIAHRRSWPVHQEGTESPVEFDDAHFATLDASIQAQLARGRRDLGVATLLEGCRYSHALELARDAVRGDAGVTQHVALAEVAALLGERDEAVASYRRALELDPAVRLPTWAAAALAEGGLTLPAPPARAEVACETDDECALTQRGCCAYRAHRRDHPMASVECTAGAVCPVLDSDPICDHGTCALRTRFYDRGQEPLGGWLDI